LAKAVDGIMRATHTLVTETLKRLRYLGPLRPYPARHVAMGRPGDPSWDANSGETWSVLREDSDIRERVNAWLRQPERLETRYELRALDWVELDQAASLDDVRTYLERAWDAYASEPGDTRETVVGRVFEDPQLYARVVRATYAVAGFSGMTELVLVDQHSGTAVSHRDVGFGISQVLPVLVEAYAPRGQIIAIEQPELHLHPKLQAELGDVFIQSALGEEQRNTFILETHSEHLILRVMRRMRETARGEPFEGMPVRPEDVAVLFVERVGASSVVRELRLNEEGELIDDWPGGFFEEGFRERFA
jgi:hypothetical protein